MASIFDVSLLIKPQPAYLHSIASTASLSYVQKLMNGYYPTTRRSFRKLSYALSLALGLAGTLLLPYSVSAQEQDLTWARVDFLRNRVQLVPQDQQGRRARISDVLSVGDSLRTARASRAELRFNDGSLARIGERATFRFTPNTRNFQLSNGTILLLIPPGRGRSTIQTPNAVTGIQGSALFVRYIPETDTTIVGALTNNPNGPMVLFNRDGTEQQALRANEIGVIQGNQITELYEFDGTLFWQSSGLAEGFNYLSDSSTGSDALDGVRQEIREAISTQGRISGDRVITNPETFATPSTDLPEDDIEADDAPAPVLEFEDSPAEDYLQSSAEAVDERQLEVGVNNTLEPSSAGDEEVALETAEVDTESSSADADSPAEAETSNDADAVEADAVDADTVNADSMPTQPEETSADVVELDVTDSDTTDPGVTDSDVTDSDITDSSVTDSDVIDSGNGDSGLGETPNNDLTTDSSQPETTADPIVPVTQTLDVEASADEGGAAGPPASNSLPSTPTEVPETPNENTVPLNGGVTEVPTETVGEALSAPSEAITVPTDDVGDVGSSVSAPIETIPTETVPTETIPTETIPTETIPTETIPTETIPTETIPTETTIPETSIEEVPLVETELPDTIRA
ncbi:MAG: FecR domain-containing protein, partial [Cyanobacteria bacterium J06650_10]